MLKVLSVFGTRPEAIKMAPVIRQLESSSGVASTVCVTGQHRQMLDQVLELFGVVPDIDLNLMRSGQTPTAVLTAALTALGPILDDVQPDIVLVQGDTTTAMAAGLAAAYAGVKVGHIEAGLRTFDKTQPFPEELNRLIIGACGDLHFTPTPTSAKNLLAEAHDPATVWVCGNTVIDALLDVANTSFEPHDDDPLASVPWDDHRVILLTTHRRENFGAPMRAALRAVAEVVDASEDPVHVVFPAHPNPKVTAAISDTVAEHHAFSVIEPLDYRRLVWTMGRCDLVITDSGGIQEEAPSLGRPVLVLRDTTERPEAVEFGTVKLVGCDREKIVASATELLCDREAYDKMARSINPYGDGRAAERIVAAITGQPVVEFDPYREIGTAPQCGKFSGSVLAL